MDSIYRASKTAQTGTAHSSPKTPIASMSIFADGSKYNNCPLGHVQFKLFLLGLLVSLKKKMT